MKKRLSLVLSLEDGKNTTFSISDIKDITADQAGDIIKTFDYKNVLAKDNLKVVGIKKAEIISTNSEEITIV